MKTIVTIAGIRPDFIRLSAVIKKLDNEPDIKHILIHTGQHFSEMLSDVFFKELDIRQPDYNLGIGGIGKEHYHQTAELSVKLIELFKTENIKPDYILFLGDSNSVLVAPILKKEGYKIGHIEAGMRSGDRRMLEEINRTVCDHCSDLFFVYHMNYREKLLAEGILSNQIMVVGNTIVEVCKPFSIELSKISKLNNQIILDIHRPENFKDKERLKIILEFANYCNIKCNIPVKMLSFPRASKYIEEYKLDIGCIETVPLMSYKEYLKEVYNSLFIISDSGTAQEEPALLNTPVIVPREFTERPESYMNKCSFKLFVNMCMQHPFDKAQIYKDTLDTCLKYRLLIDERWLGTGNTSSLIVERLKMELY
jgi:UDP-N-acetylglucosamine 2-epimerase (non-hydrolysing)